MKKIINGSVYNTETAKKIGEAISIILYKTKARKYFLYKKEFNEIIPLILEEAEEWSKKFLSEDEYKAEFGIKDENIKETICLSLPSETKRQLEKMSSQKNKSVSQIVTELVKKYN